MGSVFHRSKVQYGKQRSILIDVAFCGPVYHTLNHEVMWEVHVTIVGSILRRLFCGTF